MYQEGRFLGGFEYSIEYYKYTDSSQGDLITYAGKEWIARDKTRVYELEYHGGMIKP